MCKIATGVLLKTLQLDLEKYGWTHLEASSEYDEIISFVVDETARLLGPMATARAGATREIVVPLHRVDAHPRSQSAAYGLGPLPFHVELSHRQVPCRYLVLGCLDPGQPSCSTTLLDWRSLGFTSHDLSQLRGAPLLVRNGRRSFYTSALPADGRFLRYDVECIEAVDARGRAALNTIQTRLSAAASISQNWRRGDILVIDNWRMLHGREAVQQDSGRRLVRRLVDA